MLRTQVYKIFLTSSQDISTLKQTLQFITKIIMVLSLLYQHIHSTRILHNSKV